MWLKRGNQRVHSSGRAWIILNPTTGRYAVYYRAGKVIYLYQWRHKVDFTYRSAQRIAGRYVA